MVYTVTINPSLDYIINVDHFIPGSVNRSLMENLYPGGKGINVSIVLKNLGFETTSLGFTAGFTGEKIEQFLLEHHIATDFIKLPEGFSRINIKMRSHEESEINGSGPLISEKDIVLLYKKLENLKSGDILVLAGSVPFSIPDTLYADIMNILKDKEVKIIVDAANDLLKHVLPCHPFLVKPNNHELSDLFDVPIYSKQDVVTYARKLRSMGAQNVLISMAEEGALLITENDDIFSCKANPCKPVNSVGAGDSMVAGFISGYTNSCSYEKALKMGVVCGTASVLSEWLPSKNKIEEVLAQNLKVVHEQDS